MQVYFAWKFSLMFCHLIQVEVPLRRNCFPISKRILLPIPPSSNLLFLHRVNTSSNFFNCLQPVCFFSRHLLWLQGTVHKPVKKISQGTDNTVRSNLLQSASCFQQAGKKTRCRDDQRSTIRIPQLTMAFPRLVAVTEAHLP